MKGLPAELPLPDTPPGEGLLTRRRFLRFGRGFAALAAAGVLPAWRSVRRVRFQETPFTLGVASGDPTASGAVLWTRLDPGELAIADAASREVTVRWEVSADDAFRQIVRSGESRALPELGHSVHAEVEGLEAGRWYWYRFDAGGIGSPAGRLRTAPAPGEIPGRLRFAFASCQHYEHGYYTAYRHMAAEEPELIIHLGDYIYEMRYGDIVRDAAPGEVMTLADYRNRYALYRSDPDLQDAHAACPWIVTWDDHEVDNNYAGTVPEDAQGRQEFLMRRAAAYQAYYEFMPLRRSSMPTGPAMQLFRRLDFGDLASFHVLDTRQYRSDQACGDGRAPRCWPALAPDRTLLGAAQEAWLHDGLASGPARWNFLAQQVRMAEVAIPPREGESEESFSLDMWDGYPAERERLLGFLAPRGDPESGGPDRRHPFALGRRPQERLRRSWLRHGGRRTRGLLDQHRGGRNRRTGIHGGDPRRQSARPALQRSPRLCERHTRAGRMPERLPHGPLREPPRRTPRDARLVRPRGCPCRARAGLTRRRSIPGHARPAAHPNAPRKRRLRIEAIPDSA